MWSCSCSYTMSDLSSSDIFLFMLTCLHNMPYILCFWFLLHVGGCQNCSLAGKHATCPLFSGKPTHTLTDSVSQY